MSKEAAPNKKGLSRRGMLKGLGAGAVAAAVGPAILRGEEAKGAPVLTGTGAYTFKWVDSWCQLPETHKFGNTHGVQVDSQGRVLIHSQGAVPDSVLIFDPAGKFIKSWGKEYTNGAHGLQLVKEAAGEFLYLAATGQNVCLKTTLDGEVVWKITTPDHPAYKGEKPRKFVPTNIAVTKAGDVFVADGYGGNWIHKYTAKGEYVKSFGGPGKEAGQLACPHGIWIDTRSGTEEVLVADRSNVRLQYFDLEGKHLRIVTRDGDKLRHPCHFDVHDGVLLIPDLHSRVTLLDKDNNLLTHLGDNEIKNYGGINGRPKDQWKQGQFIAPHGACFDKDGNIFVAEWVKPGRVTKLEKVKA